MFCVFHHQFIHKLVVDIYLIFTHINKIMHPGVVRRILPNLSQGNNETCHVTLAVWRRRHKGPFTIQWTSDIGFVHNGRLTASEVSILCQSYLFFSSTHLHLCQRRIVSLSLLVISCTCLRRECLCTRLESFTVHYERGSMINIIITFGKQSVAKLNILQENFPCVYAYIIFIFFLKL